MVSQQRALMTLYAGLTRGEDRESRKKIYEALDQAAERTGADPPRMHELLDRQLDASTVGEFTEEFRALATRPAERHDAVLAIQNLELLLAVSRRFLADTGGARDTLAEVVRGAEGNDEITNGLVPFMNSLLEGIDDPTSLESAILLAQASDDIAIELDGVQVPDTAAKLTQQQAPPIEQSEEQSEEPLADSPIPPGPPLRRAEREVILLESGGEIEPPDNPTDQLLRLIERVPGIDAAAELSTQPSMECVSLLIRLEIDGDNGREGEIGTFIQTTLLFDTADYDDLTFDYCRDTLLDPRFWHTYHPFWCSMDEVTAGNLPPDVVLADLEAQCQAAPNADGHWMIWERVGLCGEPNRNDFFPRTYLCFERNAGLKAYSPNSERSLSYRLLQCPDAALAVDDGQIVVTDLNPYLRVRITKTLHLRGINHQTEGQSLAEFACEAGWADQTRNFILNALLSDRNPIQ